MIWDWELDGWIIVVAALSAVACALPGCFLVLRKMSMMGDAISHAVLPGLAVAFLVTGSRESLTMFVGAAVVGVLTAVFIQAVHQWGRVEQSAAMGVIFTVLFAGGLILMKMYGADAVDLDPGCVLYGQVETVPLTNTVIGGVRVPTAVIALGAVLLINLVFIVLLYKELKISTFDPSLATTLGINANLMHYLLMSVVAVTTVAAFQVVGSILVIAMLIVPAAAAHLLTDRLSVMLVIASVIAAVSAAVGHVGAVVVPGWFGFVDAAGFSQSTNTAGMMAVTVGLIFLAALLGSPRYGLISRVVHRGRLAVRIACEDVLGFLFRLEEAGGGGGVGVLAGGSGEMGRVLSHVGGLNRRLAVRALLRKRLIERMGEGLGLTETGRGMARRLVRSHRLWETYLTEQVGLAADHVHTTAERLEHVTDAGMREALERDTSRAEKDPHGREIPSE